MSIEEFKVKVKDKMCNLKHSYEKFFKVFGSYVIALARLVIWTILTFFSLAIALNLLSNSDPIPLF